MAGAHFDSWVAADGATDNAAGSAVVMEAARILKTMGVRPKRTIRFVLWSGEEQGLLGSLSYVDKYLASRPGPAEGEDGNLLYYGRSEEHTSELQSLMRHSYAVFCLKKKKPRRQ